MADPETGGVIFLFRGAMPSRRAAPWTRWRRRAIVRRRSFAPRTTATRGSMPLRPTW